MTKVLVEFTRNGCSSTCEGWDAPEIERKFGLTLIKIYHLLKTHPSVLFLAKKQHFKSAIIGPVLGSIPPVEIRPITCVKSPKMDVYLSLPVHQKKIKQ